MADFDDMMDDDDSTDGRAKPAAMWIRSPAVNSIELALLDLGRREPLLEIDVEFLDGPAPANRETENPELTAIRAQVGEHWFEHIALARSLGERATYSDYVAACARELMQPVYLDPQIVGVSS